MFIIFGNGKESPIVKSFNLRKFISIHSFCFPDASVFFGTTNRGAFHWLVLGRIMSSSNIFVIWRFTSSLCFSGSLYGLTFIDALSAFVVILCATAVVNVVSFSRWNMSQKSSLISSIAFFSSLFKCSRRSYLFRRSLRVCIDSALLLFYNVSTLMQLLICISLNVTSGVVISTGSSIMSTPSFISPCGSIFNLNKI